MRSHATEQASHDARRARRARPSRRATGPAAKSPLVTSARTDASDGPRGRAADEVSRPQHVEGQPVALDVDQSPSGAPRADHPRIRIGLALTDDLPPGMHIEHEGEWVVGIAFTRTTPSRRATLSPVADTPRREPARLCPAAVPEEVTLAKAKLDAVIAAVPLFETLSKRHLKKVAGLTTTVEFDAGDTVIQEGEPGDSFFVTVSGQAKVVSGGKTVHRLIPGDHFGEISLLDGRPRSASVVAETPLSLLRLPRASFLRLVEDDADLARALLASLARMVRRVDRSLAK